MNNPESGVVQIGMGTGEMGGEGLVKGESGVIDDVEVLLDDGGEDD